MGNPAERLTGLSLDGMWTVVEPVTPGPKATGGCFSIGYIVEGSNGERAYLKALDFTKALHSDDPARVLEAVTKAFNHERDLCKKCRGRGFSRVVNILSDGRIMVRQNGGHEGVVQYIIFELAERDVRAHMDTMDAFDTAFLLRASHHVAVGLHQLHSAGIAHQDLKPSNVLVFSDRTSKVGDLGRSVQRGLAGPYDDLEFPGDPAYAPPELLYSFVPSHWERRRLGCDMYLLGSLVVFLFSRLTMTGLLAAHLDSRYHWSRCDMAFEEALPYLRHAFGEAIRQFRAEAPAACRDQLAAVVRQLCDPDPQRRGHPMAERTGSQYSLERFITRFDLLARRAETGLFG